MHEKTLVTHFGNMIKLWNVDEKFGKGIMNELTKTLTFMTHSSSPIATLPIGETVTDGVKILLIGNK